MPNFKQVTIYCNYSNIFLEDELLEEISMENIPLYEFSIQELRINYKFSRHTFKDFANFEDYINGKYKRDRSKLRVKMCRND